MALEAVVYQDWVGYNKSKDPYDLFGEDCNCDFLENQTENCHPANWNTSPPSTIPYLDQWVPDSSLEPHIPNSTPEDFDYLDTMTTESSKPRRRRPKTKNNLEAIEKQRMVHIAVERNRRKQMNEYLSVLREFLPDSYVLKGDQASTVAGAIDYVTELEQQLHFLSGQKHMETDSSWPFAEFFSFPQYSTSSTTSKAITDPMTAQSQPAMADIEVRIVDSHANLKIRTKKRPKQLLKIVSGLQNLMLTILILGVTTADQIVIYSLNVKVEDGCKLTSVNEIATAVKEMLGSI
ncbi:hypothetical protein RJ640_028546 [Escallonia rubra]|uniref:BHLH domain-containing protein n=1 Tax=Escallonia rubra TaxID=112253 RepID=A0AA88R8H4_9ASTE|nr:hypothetical protein RJ640_028546 [Escallonia rubra]